MVAESLGLVAWASGEVPAVTSCYLCRLHDLLSPSRWGLVSLAMASEYPRGAGVSGSGLSTSGAENDSGLGTSIAEGFTTRME